MTIWSPSHVNKWLECPLKWSLQRQGVEGVREKWSPGLVVGTALHAGLAQAFGGSEQDAAYCGEIAGGTLANDWPQGDTGDFDLDVVRHKMLNALAKALDKRGELLGDYGRVLGVEVKLGDGDRETGQYPGTADLITQHGNPPGIDAPEYLCITDWKSHWSLDDYYVEKELSETERNWQLHQYAWFAQQVYSVPVKYLRKVVIRCVPSAKVWVYTHEVTQRRLEQWHGYALEVWDRMGNDAGCEPPWSAPPNWQSCRKYGKCEYYHRPECHGGN